MGCVGAQSHSVRSIGRLIAAATMSGQSCSDLELRHFIPRLSTGSPPAAAPSMAENGPALRYPANSTAVA